MKEIRKIIAAYDAWKGEGIQMALATVVKVEESSYRRIGARMLVGSSGLFVGGISGGCLEGNALKKAQLAIHKNATSKVVYDTLEEDDHQIGIGLGCNGRIEIMFSPINQSDTLNPVELLRKTIEADQSALLLKVIGSSDSSLLGTNQLLVDKFQEASIAGLDWNDLQSAIELTWSRKRPKVFEFKNKSGVSVELLAEYLRPETRLVIVGNNYDVNALIGVAKELGWQISVMSKKEKILKSISTQVDRLYDYSEVSQIPIDEYTAVILMTHDYNWDLNMLPHFINVGLPYLGLLGPKKRFNKLNEEINEIKKIGDLSDHAHIHAPVGLDIGAESPEEIALSIAAEIVTVFRKRDARPLKFRAGTIHEREG